MSDDDKVHIRLEITRELLLDLQRLGLSDEDILAVVTGKFESDEHANRIADVIERNGKPLH